MKLLAQVAQRLRAGGIAHAVIGAAALAVHGVARATADLDLLATDRRCLDAVFWHELDAAGVVVQVRTGDASDPLAGVVRFAAKDEAPVDLILGRPAWQAELLGRAEATRLVDLTLPVVSAPDLVLLKLYAGGPQDAWDIDQLLDVDPGIGPEVESHLSLLPEESAALWRRIRRERRG